MGEEARVVHKRRPLKGEVDVTYPKGGVQKLRLYDFDFFLSTYPQVCVDILYVDKKWTFWTTYLPRLVNVVCERPPNDNLIKELQGAGGLGSRIIKIEITSFMEGPKR